MVVATGYIDQAKLASEVEKAARRLGPEVVRLKHRLGPDTNGDPSIDFRIVLADDVVQKAIHEDTVAEVTGRIMGTLFEELHPYENWGLVPYFAFRSLSEEPTPGEWA